MNFQIDVSSCTPTSDTAPPPHAAPSDVAELLRQILEVQREQLAYQRNAAAAHDMTARWRAFLSRWNNEFPGLSDSCRRVLPMLEKCYGQMINDLTERISEDDALDSEF